MTKKLTGLPLLNLPSRQGLRSLFTFVRDRFGRLSLVIVISLLLTTACNLPFSTQSETAPIANLEGAILFWIEQPVGLTGIQGSRYQDAVQEAADSFTALHPQVQIFLKFFAPTEKWEFFERPMKRGGGPDLILAESSVLPWFQTGALRALEEDKVNADQFRADAFDGGRFDGKLYGLPLYMNTQVLCYNKNIVQEPPRTLTELKTQARKGYSVGMQSNFAFTFWGTGIFGGRLFDENGYIALAEGEGWVQWMYWLKAAQREPNFILSEDTDALQQAFLEGRLAYLTCPSSDIPYLYEELGKQTLGAAPLPGEDRPATPALWSSVLLFSQASRSNQYQIALKLAKFMTNVEQQQLLEAEIPFIPANKNVKIDPRLFPIRNTLIEQSKTAVPFTQNRAKLDVLLNLGNEFYKKVLAGTMTPEAAAFQLSQSVNEQFGLE